jgi:hypothetical protein
VGGGGGLVRLRLDPFWERFRARVDGLTDDELAWRPAPAAPELSIVWRMAHLVVVLGEQRNWRWLGREPSGPEVEHVEAATADEALAAVDAAWAAWKALADSLSDEELAQPIGPVGGWFAGEERAALVLHIADELVHHAAEVALLRDLYAAAS